MCGGCFARHARTSPRCSGWEPIESTVHDPHASYNRGYDIAQQQDGPHHDIAAFTNQVASTPGRHGVPFGKRGPAAGPPVPQRTNRNFSQGAGTGESTGGATLPGRPGPDAPRHERAAFLAKHKICFAFAFQGACPRQECPFNHDPSLIPAGYIRPTRPLRSGRRGREAERSRAPSAGCMRCPTSRQRLWPRSSRRTWRRSGARETNWAPEGAPRGRVHPRGTR